MGSAPYDAAARIASVVSVGYSAMISASDIPAATQSSTTLTGMRVPLMQARPWAICGSTLMRSRCSTNRLVSIAQCTSTEAKPRSRHSVGPPTSESLLGPRRLELHAHHRVPAAVRQRPPISNARIRALHSPVSRVRRRQPLTAGARMARARIAAVSSVPSSPFPPREGAGG